MIPAEQRLRFAVEFAGLQLHNLTSRELPRVRREIAVFLLGGGKPHWAPGGGLVAVESDGDTLMAVPPYPGGTPDQLSRQALSQLQRTVTQILQPIAEASERPRPAVGTGAPGIECTIRYTINPNANGATTQVLLHHMPVRDAFLWLFAELLREVPTDRIRRCPEAGCQRIFFRVRGQQYCSPRCTDRANKRAWRRKRRRTDAKWRAKENDRKKRQYLPKRKRRTT